MKEAGTTWVRPASLLPSLECRWRKPPAVRFQARSTRRASLLLPPPDLPPELERVETRVQVLQLRLLRRAHVRRRQHPRIRRLGASPYTRTLGRPARFLFSASLCVGRQWLSNGPSAPLHSALGRGLGRGCSQALHRVADELPAVVTLDPAQRERQVRLHGPQWVSGACWPRFSPPAAPSGRCGWPPRRASKRGGHPDNRRTRPPGPPPANPRPTIVAQQGHRLIEPLTFVLGPGLGVGTPQLGHHLVLGCLTQVVGHVVYHRLSAQIGRQFDVFDLKLVG